MDWAGTAGSMHFPGNIYKFVWGKTQYNDGCLDRTDDFILYGNINTELHIFFMFGMNDPKKIQQMMKKLNMDIREMEAEEVIIKQKNKTLKIKKPEIMIANMMGKDVYQISGELYESVSEDDIKLVMEQTGKDRQTVEQKLEELNNDLAKVIMELKEK
ncbi:MAG: hypothetical protein HY513_02840 [Candidatus Aenigmarchaeota archaeon]|nr:hypothetical protein [Candidatus Aenigmarchaeota archaeon]